MCHPSPIQLMIVDDCPLIRHGVSVMLASFPDIHILKEASDGEEALRLCTRYHPDVVLMEALLPRMSGVVATRIIRQRYPAVQVMIFTNAVDDGLLHDAFAAGAVGYLLKNTAPAELARAIHSTAQGRTHVDHEVTQHLIHAAVNPKPELGADLTDREREVLNLMVTGMHNRTIAQNLTVSQSTVKFHVSNILAKLHTKARTEAIGVALRHHLVS